MRTIAALPASALAAGAAAGFLLADPPQVLAYGVLIAGAAAACFAWRVADVRLLAAAVVASFFVGGALLSADAWHTAWRPSLWTAFEELSRAQRQEAEAAGRRLPLDDEAFAIVRGRLRSDASLTPAGVSLTLDVEALEGLERQDGHEQPRPERDGFSRATGAILVTVAGSLATEQLGEWRTGRRVRMPVQLRRPSRYLNPGVPDQERALARRGARLVGSVKSGALVDVLARGSVIDEILSAGRAYARRAIADAVGRWGGQSAAIVAAIVIGDRAGLTDDVQRLLQEAGTYHVIAISGGNIAILGGLLILVSRVAGWLGRGAMVTAIVLLIAYARLVGDSASVDRATLMAVVFFGARAIDQRSPPLNALAVVAAVLVMADPLSVADPAFILTFGATLAILVVTPYLRTRDATARDTAEAERKVGSASSAGSALIVVCANAARSMFVASVAAEAVLFPVVAAIFSRVTFAGLGLNLLAIPMMAIAQVAGLALVPLHAVSRPCAAAAGWIAHLGADGLMASADLVGYVPILTYRLAEPSWTAMAIYYVAAAVSWTLWRRRETITGTAEATWVRRTRRIASCAALCGAIWILVDPASLVARQGDERLHVTFLDVGQGDSIFVVFPRGRAMLVDTGGLPPSSTFDIGDRVVAPVIRAAGIRRLDYLALTHGDPDHIGGAASIVREFRPREVWEGIPVPRFEPLTAIRLSAQAAGARWSNVYAGDRTEVDGVQVMARHPTTADWERQKVRNDDSLVLELRWRDVSILLTGDIGKVPEQAIAPTLSPARIRVVKVPHHGSLTSSSWDFLKAAHPQIAVVSAGRSNHFGHPAPEVLDRYRLAGAEVFRTDRDGAVTVDTDGVTVQVRTYNGPPSGSPRKHENTK